MTVICAYCDQPANRVGVYSDQTGGELSARVPICPDHTAPCNHPADPYASFLREDPINDLDAAVLDAVARLTTADPEGAYGVSIKLHLVGRGWPEMLLVTEVYQALDRLEAAGQVETETVTGDRARPLAQRRLCRRLEGAP